MFNTLKHASTRTALLAAALFATATSAFAQAPTDAQKSAIRSACRSDFMAHCSSVTPGGAEAFQCLQKNMSSLSAACQTAVRAIAPAAPPKAEAAPPKAEPVRSEPIKPEPPKPEPAKPEPAKIQAAPAADPAAKPAAEPVAKPAAATTPKTTAPKRPSSAQVSAAPGGAAAAAPAPAAAVAPAAVPAVIVLRPLLPREQLFIARSACAADIGTLCAGVAPGGGRVAECLAARSAALSPACRDVLAPFAAR